jgi:hypothetical protein
MIDSSVESHRKDEWSGLLLLVMKTTLSVAHELELPPDSTLNCAARHLRFHDFAWFASAMQGASRAHACCESRGNISAVEVAYIKTLAARLKKNRNALAGSPTVYASDHRTQTDAPGEAFGKVAKAIEMLKDEIQREFSQSSVSTITAVQNASGFARALVAITPSDGNSEAYGRALGAVLRVRFATYRHVASRDADNGEHHRIMNGHDLHEQRAFAPDGWTQRVKNAIGHTNGLHK